MHLEVVRHRPHAGLVWYGAIRYEAGRKGFNSVEAPGPSVGQN